MRKNARVLSAAVALAIVGSLSGAFASACTGDAVGVEACQQIEAARCESATACGVSDTESQYCSAFYRDQCLHGMTNPGSDPSTASINACTEAIHATAGCARTGAASMAQCPTIALASGVDPTTILPCAIIKRTPEVLSACAFIQPTGDGTSSTGAASMPDASSDADASP
ncbi:MAG: hypothetical protein IPM54_27380 [Polyangiaceae bacterium]|nr:hypothetical protein [Polyangiaceae bacterium]